MRFERRENPGAILTMCAPLAAIAVALVLSGLLIAVAGASPFKAFTLTLQGAFGSRLGLSETLTRATPLILTGLAAAIAFRARLWNIGAEGQFLLGALVVPALGAMPFVAALPGPLAILCCMLAAALAGALLLLAPLGLRLRYGVDEVVTTLLLNFVVLLLVSTMVEGLMKDPLAFGWPQSIPVPDSAVLPNLIARSRLHVGLPIAVGLALFVWWVQSRTVFGMRSRAAGLNPAAARFAGVSLGRTLVVVACLSGGSAGIAGAIEVMGVKGYVTTDLSPGFGYSGIVIAMLANLNPIGVIAAALFSALMFVGADSMSRILEVPSYIADVAVALSLLSVLLSVFLAQYRIRR
ncbi:ABC transporter permease [Paracoccus sp. 1_MG-2023]|uniref:ABC transporter permease n=1 Tax=unclassified Paracoccus (in: a-proteobacteria) TaxID=2688777 RepID=UPI001C08B21C|nr:MULTISPECIES: ABC transporter permease [unclassified Paracoccus (in: a-proteobacteria)]MBU2959108.1 ABC transporter permease [Paracoccus sp. C2R09]MDO6669392.1 ABC transporter permease [Paracoccus sp. 1_MG-2023]